MENLQTTTPTRWRRVPSVASESPPPNAVDASVDGDPTVSEYESTTEDTTVPNTPHTLLTEDPFSNETSKILFESIDELRKWGAGQDLELPQLVIVGKQSAGKSSLLQSLTDIPFPVGTKLCTRFATRIVSRRTVPGTADVVRASIEPGDINPFNYSPDRARLEAFEQIIPSMTAEAFEKLIQQAKDVMGINPNRGSESRNFSSMVLKIELTGPKRSHFGILDVPGVFSATIRDDVQVHEMNGVTAMVSSYMKRKENIIICVADASDDLVNQQILGLLKGLEVDTSRIVGVLSKCDRAEKPEDIVQIVKDGEGIQGKSLRWHVVLNRGPRSPVDFDRELTESTTFNKGPWAQIPSEQRGTTMLKKFLADLLAKRIREAFPGMENTVSKLLQNEKANRKTFGSARSSYNQCMAYLIDIVQRYQDQAHKSLSAPEDLPANDLKLRGLTVKAKEEFDAEMMERGLKYKFVEIGQPVESEYDPDAVEDPDDDDDYDYDSQRGFVPLAKHNSRKLGYRGYELTPAAFPARTLPKSNIIPIKLDPLYAEIRKQMRVNRGEELPGMLNPAVLRPLWRKQTSKWKELGEKHLETIINITTDVSLRIFKFIAKQIGLTGRALSKFEETILTFSDESRQKIMKNLGDMCEKNSKMALQTTDRDFQKKVRESQLQRFNQAVERFYKIQPPHVSLESLYGGQLSNILPELQPNYNQSLVILHNGNLELLFNQMHPNGGREQNTEDEIHDILRAYYDISLKNYIYDINHNIVEPFLTSPTGPLFGLSTEYIMGLSEAEIEDLGGEDERIVQARKESDRQIEKLERALRIARDAWRRTREMGH